MHIFNSYKKFCFCLLFYRRKIWRYQNNHYLCSTIEQPSCMQEINQQSEMNQPLITPGEQLQRELDERGLTQKDLADTIDKPTPLINEIVNNKRRFSAEMSALIGVALGMPSDYWLNLQVQYEISRIEQEDGFDTKKQSIVVWNRLKEIVNVGYLKKRFNLSSDTSECINKIFQYFGVDTIDAFEEKAKSVCDAFYRKSEKSQTDSINLLTWIMIVKHDSEAWSQTLNPFKKEKERELIQELNSVFLKNQDTINNVQSVLNKYGIKYFKEDKLDKVPVDGYSFWIGSNPTIAMTKRFDRIDYFAFTLMHEIGHIIKHISPDAKKDSIDIVIESNRDYEKEANMFAEKSLINGAPIEELFSRCKNPYTADYEIIRFANDHHIHRSIIAGQYRNHINSYSACSRLIDKIG